MSKKIGRNDPCPCGSGKKHKKCCLYMQESAEKKKLDHAEAVRAFAEMKKNNFIMKPYTGCPKCHKPSYGIQMDFSSGHHYVRGCAKCGHVEKVSLPPIKKQVVYLDQNIISEMTNVLDIKSPNYERVKQGPHFDFWVEAWKTLNRLVKKQLVICPDSPFHKQESLVAKNSKKLFKTYERLSHGATFQPDDVIQRFQSNHYLKKHLGLVSGDISFDPQSIIRGDQINDWHNNFRISVGQIVLPNEAENLRSGRQDAYEYLKNIHPYWKSTSKTFDQLVHDEAMAFTKAQVSSVDRYLEDQQKILSGEIQPDIYNTLPPFALDWLTQTRQIVEAVASTEEEKKRVIDEFFLTDKILSVPSILLSSLMYASVAISAKNGAKIPSRGMFNDVQSISAYLPYCDAMFVDNENARYLSSPQIKPKIGRFNTEIFSLSSKEKFLEYLRDIENSSDPEHLRIVTGFYRTDFSSSDISDDFFESDDEPDTSDSQI